MVLLLHKPEKAVGTFRASPWYEQSCFILESMMLNCLIKSFDSRFPIDAKPEKSRMECHAECVVILLLHQIEESKNENEHDYCYVILLISLTK